MLISLPFTCNARVSRHRLGWHLKIRIRSIQKGFTSLRHILKNKPSGRWTAFEWRARTLSIFHIKAKIWRIITKKINNFERKQLLCGWERERLWFVPSASCVIKILFRVILIVIWWQRRRPCTETYKSSQIEWKRDLVFWVRRKDSSHVILIRWIVARHFAIFFHLHFP